MLSTQISWNCLQSAITSCITTIQIQIEISLTISKNIYNLDAKSKLKAILIRFFTLTTSLYRVTKTLIIRLNRSFNFLLINNNCKSCLCIVNIMQIIYILLFM